VLIQAIVDQGLPGQIDGAIDGSVTNGAIGSALSGLYSQLYNDEIVPVKTAVEQGFPYVQGELDKQGTRITALEAAALAGEGVSQTVINSLLARLDALEAENAALKAQDAEIVAFVTEKYVDKTSLQGLEGAIIDQLSNVLTDITGIKADVQWNNTQIEGHDTLILANTDRIQRLMNAINGGPNGDATVQSITEMFWLLNDIIAALVEATGVNFPGGGK